MNENDLSFLIRGAAFKVHTELGPGLLESVYEVTLSHELRTIGLEVKNQGLLINFNIVSLKYGIVRIVNIFNICETLPTGQAGQRLTQRNSARMI